MDEHRDRHRSLVGQPEHRRSQREGAVGRADLTRDEDSRRIVWDTLSRYKGLDFVWKHVGHPGPAAVEGIDMSAFDLAIDLNLRTVLMTTEAEDRLIERKDLVDLTAPGIERFIVAPRAATFEIVVNSRLRTVSARRVTFEQIVQIAFPGQHEPNVTFSMTYRHAASSPHAGELGAGGSVNVKKKGTVFNVTRTVQS